jgi:hypothetical protein
MLQKIVIIIIIELIGLLLLLTSMCVCMYVYCPFSPRNGITIRNVLILFFSPVITSIFFSFSWNCY